MKALLSVLAILVSTALAGCVTVSPNNSQAAVTVSKVQEATMRACAFLPAAQTVVAITGYRNPNLDTAQELATLICASLRSGAPVQGSRI